MRRLTFQIKVTGPKPDQVSAKTLGEILIRVEAALSEFAKQAGIELPADGPALSLVDVEEGSDLLTFSIPESAAPAMSVISGAIAADEYSALPRESHQGIYEVSETVRSAGWGLEILRGTEAGIPPSVITPDRGVPAPPKEEVSKLRGTTTLLARCLRVGGATAPKVEVRPVQGGRALNLDVSENMAKRLGRRLYEEVLLRGEATWEMPSWKMIEFRVQELVDFERVSPGSAFRELAELAGSTWDDVDALEFVRSQRDEE